jgi:hypothetical protein
VNAAVLVEAVSAGVGAAVVTGESFRRYWSRREVRQQAAFRRAVQAIVADAVADVLDRQAASEQRQRRHLDRQDRKLDLLAAEVQRNHEGSQQP